MLMKDKKIDLRIRRTHKLLIDALVDFLVKKPFEEISVTDICEKAMVHRTTFYNHFEDKYDLLDFFFETLQLEFDTKTQLDISQIIRPKDYVMNLLRHVLEFMEKNKELYVLGIFRLGNDSVMAIFHQSICDYIKDKLDNDIANLGVTSSIPTTIVAEYHAGALLSLASWWLKSDSDISIDEIVGYTNLLIHPELYMSVPHE